MSGSLPTYPKASGCCGCFVGPTSWTGNHLRACADDCLTPACIYCRILSLACSPNGASFVCSAAAPSLTSQTDSLAPDIGSKGMNQVPGKLLLWDTKTMKQQVRGLPGGHPGAAWRAPCVEGTPPTLPVVLMSLFSLLLSVLIIMGPSQLCCLSPFTEILS